MGADELLRNNLDNIKHETDLFGNKIEKLSMSERIGFVPISIWEPDWEKVNRLKPIIGDDGSERELVGKQMKLMGSKYTTSIFNPHLAQMILSAYCPAQANIFDPFGGGGTRGFVATAMGHKYTGVELRENEVSRIMKQQKHLDKYFTIICGDSRKHPIAPDSFDFSYTCPPYYDLEVYSDNPDDMSNAPCYKRFIDMITESMQVTYNGLRPGCLSVWVVGNFRDKHGTLTHFNGDLVQASRYCGFKLHDELIFWGASKCAAQRAGQFEANRKSVRVHEYILIFKK